MRRLRLGELVALVGAVTLLVMLFLQWYDVSLPRVDFLAEGPNEAVMAATGDLGAHTGGWEAVGVWISCLLGIAIALGLGLAAATVTRRSPAVPVALGVLTWVVGSIVWIVLLVRLLHEPGLGLDLPGDAVTLRWPGYVGFLAATLIPIGGLLSIRDERTDAPESAYTPPPPRPIPESAADDPADS